MLATTARKGGGFSEEFDHDRMFEQRRRTGVYEKERCEKI
jgi:hypothetical protein